MLVAYATKHGSTRQVAESIAESIRGRGWSVRGWRRRLELADALGEPAAVVLGGALYTGRWHRDAARFLASHQAELGNLPLAVFAMGPRTLETQDVAQGARPARPVCSPGRRNFDPIRSRSSAA